MTKFFKKNTFEVIFLSLVLFAVFFSSEWSGTSYGTKISSIFIAILFIFISVIFRSAFENIFKPYKQKLLFLMAHRDYDSQNILYKTCYIVLNAFVVMTIFTLFEIFAKLLVFKSSSPITMGFPFAIYSFSANVTIYKGLLFNLIIYSLLLEVVRKLKKKIA